MKGILAITLKIIIVSIVLLFLTFIGLRFYLFSDETRKVESVVEEHGSQKVMIVFAHPDDESYTTGLLENAEKRGIETALLTFTPGEAGTQMPQVCDQRFLGDVRKAEVYKSGFMLGIDHQKVYNYGDGTLQDQNIQQLSRDIYNELVQFKPDLIITFWPQSGMTMHPDHKTIGKATQMAFNKFKREQVKARLCYTIMPPKVVSLLGNNEMQSLQPEANYAIKANARVKTELWDIHASQNQFVKNYTGMPAWLLYRLLNREYYFVAP